MTSFWFTQAGRALTQPVPVSDIHDVLSTQLQQESLHCNIPGVTPARPNQLLRQASRLGSSNDVIHYILGKLSTPQAENDVVKMMQNLQWKWLCWNDYTKVSSVETDVNRLSLSVEESHSDAYLQTVNEVS